MMLIRMGSAPHVNIQPVTTGAAVSQRYWLWFVFLFLFILKILPPCFCLSPHPPPPSLCLPPSPPLLSCIRGHLQGGASLSSSVTSSSNRRVRQLPQLPPKSSTVEQGTHRCRFGLLNWTSGEGRFIHSDAGKCVHSYCYSSEHSIWKWK